MGMNNAKCKVFISVQHKQGALTVQSYEVNNKAKDLTLTGMKVGDKVMEIKAVLLGAEGKAMLELCGSAVADLTPSDYTPAEYFDGGGITIHFNRAGLFSIT